MSVSKATLSHYPQAPRKVRLIADHIRGKRVDDALLELRFIGKRAAKQVAKLIESAVANAKDRGHAGEGLYIKEIRVDEGRTRFRREPRAMGVVNVVRRRTSHVYILLDETSPEQKEASAAAEGQEEPQSVK